MWGSALAAISCSRTRAGHQPDRSVAECLTSWQLQGTRAAGEQPCCDYHRAEKARSSNFAAARQDKGLHPFRPAWLIRCLSHRLDQSIPRILPTPASRD